MNSIHIKSDTRGQADYGWLRAKYMFSFSGYYNPQRMGFGTLRVLNDDIIQGGGGFPTHPHENMEIITVPLEGSLKHEDSMGHEGEIKKGEVQVMSAGTGVRHSEFNGSSKESTNICQIWILPDKENVDPRYDQIEFSLERNSLQQIISPNKEDQGSWIYSQTWINHGEFDQGKRIRYEWHKSDNGLFLFLIEGKIEVNGHEVNKRDGFGVWDEKSVEIEFMDDSRILLLEVPMELQ